VKRPLSFALLFAGLAACNGSAAESGARGPSLVKSAQAAELPTTASPASSAAAAAARAVDAEAWVEALRREDWAGAAKSIDALSPELRKRADLRYARARAALELADHPLAQKLLEGLESELPDLAARVRRARAEAELVVGPHSSAASYFSTQKDPESLLNAAIAYSRAQEPDKARAHFDRALVAAERVGSRARELVARVHSERASFLEAQGNKALAAIDLRWLALEAPRSRAAADADTRLATLTPKRALTKDERAGRLFTFADAGLVDAVEAEIQKIGATPGPPLGRAKLALARGLALYNARRDYTRAADLLTTAAKEGAPDPAKASFYAARAHARAHDDDRAIRLYGELARNYPKTSWAESATYLTGKTYYAGGRFPQAIQAYDSYLAKFGKRARYGKEAGSERATALLASGRFVDAARALSALRSSARDSREKSRLLELEGAARSGAGERDAAVKLFRAAIDEQPLSFAALVARARLERLGESCPPLLGSALVEATPAPTPVVPELPKTVALLNELGLDREAEAELQPREHEIEGRHAGRRNEALCRAYGKLDFAARRYQIGQNAVSAATLRNAPSPSTLWQWDCVYPRAHELVVRDASQSHGLNEALIWGIMRQESSFRPDVVSPANAVGLMQLIPPTAQRVAQELNVPFDHHRLNSPAYNVKLGSHYLKKLLGFFGGNVALAAASYNAGPQAVFRWLEGASDLPLDVFVARIPYEETRTYVERVIGNLARYRYVKDGEAGIPVLALELPRNLTKPSDLY
jgi:soluble lytic murein transglycosylase